MRTLIIYPAVRHFSGNGVFFMQRDMTVGSPFKVVLNFTIPIFIGNVFQQFYNMADAVIVGKFVGTDALAAVGSTGTIMFLIFGLITGMSVGFTVLTSQYYGAGDMDGMRRSVGSAVVLSAVITVAMTLVTVLGMRWILTIMQTPQNIFDDAYAYIVIICAGIFTQVLYNLLSSILRALGNSKTPLYFLILAALLNIVLDLVLVIVFHMGTAGAAYATVISQGISGLLCLIYIIKKVPLLKLRRSDFKLDWFLIKNQLRVGCPMALQFSITAIGTTMVQVSLNLLGSVYVAAFTAAGKIEQVVTQSYVALGTTLATYAAQNIGAQKYQRIRDGFRAATIMSLVYSVVIGILVAFAGKQLTYLFIEVDNPVIIEYVDVYLKCVTAFFIPLSIIYLYRNGIQGMGYGLLPMMGGIAELVGRAILAIAGFVSRSYLVICLASPAAWVLAAGLLLWSYYHIMKQYREIPSLSETEQSYPCKTPQTK